MIRSTRGGVPIDTDRIKMKNENKVAVGNMNVNARGDVLGRGGKIIKPVVQRVNEVQNVNRVEQVSIKGKMAQEATLNEDQIKKETPEETSIEQKKSNSNKKAVKKLPNEIELPDGSIQVIDDE